MNAPTGGTRRKHSMLERVMTRYVSKAPEELPGTISGSPKAPEELAETTSGSSVTKALGIQPTLAKLKHRILGTLPEVDDSLPEKLVTHALALSHAHTLFMTGAIVAAFRRRISECWVPRWARVSGGAGVRLDPFEAHRGHSASPAMT